MKSEIQKIIINFYDEALYGDQKSSEPVGEGVEEEAPREIRERSVKEVCELAEESTDNIIELFEAEKKKIIEEYEKKLKDKNQ